MAFALATPAHAQDDADRPPAETQTQDDEGGQVVEVTGSRIRRPTLTSVVPITSLSGDDLVGHGDVSLGDALNDLPALASTFSQANSTRFIGTAGLNILDLRDLAPERTLVLVNGRRHVTSVAGAFFVDINTIPEDLLERVDIVTGGSSAVYGSDAMGGVVNFVLRRDFEGLRARAQAGVSDEGDRGIQFITLTGGRNFADGRGNIAVSLEYVNAEPLYFTERPRLTGAYDGRCQFQQVDNTVGEPAAGDGIADNTFLCGIRNATISNGGTIGQINAAGDFLRFNDSGNLFIDVPTRSFRPVGSGNQQGGFGSTLRDTGQLAAGLDRYTANLLARFEVSPAFQPFFEGKYVHIDAVQEGQPSFFQGRLMRCDNGFLNAQSLATLQSFGLCANPATGTFPLSRFNVDFGGRQQLISRDTWRVVAGVEGDFNDDWHYEVAVNYGRYKGRTDALNDLVLADLNGNPDGFTLAADAVRNAQGQIVCRVNQVAVTRPDCVPINLFGTAPSAAALDFVNTTSTLDERASQLNVTAFMAGDLSQLFELPGGPIRFVVGTEWRRETTSQRADPLSASGATFFNAFPTFSPPDFEVLEGFGELELPILRDQPFARELTVTGAVRYSNYNTDANHTFAWNISGTWSPVRDIRFRANYSRAVRVPTLGDLFTPATQGFAQVQDPCDQAFINNGPNRAANCAALGVPTTVLAGSPCITAATPVGSPFRNCVSNSQTIGFTQAGNSTLEEETANSLTIGAVFTPSFLPGFSLTVDYYSIRVNNLIQLLVPQNILNLCVDQANTNNPYCALINPRNGFGLFANQDDILLSRVANFARQDSRGIDFDLAYHHRFGNGHVLNVRAIATVVLERTDFVNPTDPAFGDRLLGEVGDPALAANFQVEYGAGPWDLRYTLNYIGRQTVPAFYESQHSFQGRPPTNADISDREWFPDLFIHGIRMGYRVNEQFRFYAGIDNFTDRQPPLGLLGTGGGEGVDAIGRYFYAGVLVNWR
ncbi:MAG TPA: TonB-dependent receptor [Allosphingosinicella sp.]|nr:TonB-dependent receptor [Allosphingosinicella sp.]